MPYEYSMDKSMRQYKFKILIKSNSYIGQDSEKEIVIDCKPANIVIFFSINNKIERIK